MTIDRDPARMIVWGGATGFSSSELPDSPRRLRLEGLGVSLLRHDLELSGELTSPSDEYTFDPRVDMESGAFRRESRPRVHVTLQEELSELHGVLEVQDPDEMKAFLLQSADAVSRAVLGADEEADIASPDDDFGMRYMLYNEPNRAWQKPVNLARVKDELLTELVSLYCNGQMSVTRLGKGMHVLTGMLQERIDGNHRSGRGLRLMLEKAGRGERDISREEVTKMLGIDGSGQAKYDMGPDLYNLVQGVAFFAFEQKGFSWEEIAKQMMLTSLLPDTSLSKLRDRLSPGEDVEPLREEFMRYMVLDSDLQWCVFDKV